MVGIPLLTFIYQRVLIVAHLYRSPSLGLNCLAASRRARKSEPACDSFVDCKQRPPPPLITAKNISLSSEPNPPKKEKTLELWAGNDSEARSLGSSPHPSPRFSSSSPSRGTPCRGSHGPRSRGPGQRPKKRILRLPWPKLLEWVCAFLSLFWFPFGFPVGLPYLLWLSSWTCWPASYDRPLNSMR